MTIYIIDLEAVDTRYTKQWKEYLPKQLKTRTNKKIITISGGETPQTTTPGAFLNFGGTNVYKANQMQQIGKLFCDGKVKDGDYFLYTDAWNPTVLQLKYMAELLNLKIKIGGMWHAGSYDPQDFLGRLIGDKPWVRHSEQAMFESFDHNFFLVRKDLKINFLNYAFLGGASLAMLIFALVSEYVYAYQPCSLCIQQRYPHVLIVALCLIIFTLKKKISIIYVLNILLIGISIILASYHVGVENNIFLGPESCSPYDLSKNLDKSPEELLNEILAKPMISCNTVSWSFLNLSMASWNLIFSLILFFSWIFSFIKLAKNYSSSSTSQ